MRLESGQVLAGRYALLRKLGEGRTAEAWLAGDRESGVEVVLKVLRAELSSSPDERVRFLDAARLQRDIAHPGVLACTSVREEEPVLATFAFEGSSDLTRLRGAPLRSILRALAQVAEGAGALHARGCVHRDIKASNVLLADDGRALLADFGLAAGIGEATAAPGGSPFTSSPEQLAGAPPAIADDVYAFGALAYELLAGYPPFYPDAAAARTPATPQSLARRRADLPPGLEELVTRCLARRAEDRPRDMTEVLEGLRNIPDTESQSDTPRALHAPPALRAPGAGEEAIEPMWQRKVAAGPSASELRSQGFRRGLLVGTFIFLLVVAGIVFFALPGWVERHETAPVARVPAAPANAAPSKPVVSAPAVDPQAAAKRELEQKKAQEQRTAAELRAALAAGAAAIAAGDAAEARRQYGIASKIDPANAAARRGLERAKTLDEVRTLLAQAAELERNGQLAAAETAWKKALALDPDTSAARDAIARVEAQRTASAFSAAVADALAAVSRRDYAGARAAYERAGRIRPGAPEVREGLEQVQRALGDRTIAQHLESARKAEQQERWRDALTEYRAALAIDAKLLDAQQGVERVEPRVMLDAAFSSYLERPERLFSDAVRGAARATLAQAAAIPDRGPVLTRQVSDLQALLAAAETPVRLVIASDSQTDVVIYRVGRLGAFSRKDMELLPGRYTVVGTRAGFRDVRREVTIMPGNVPPELVIRCEEKI
jgi:eukaryotic-like serine/threonine-protein kinase